MHLQDYKFERINNNTTNDTIRILLMGSTDVGKTAMMEKIINDTFPPNVSRNDILHIYQKQVDWTDDFDEKQQVTLQFIDPPHGTDNFDDITYDDIDCIMLIFSMIDRESFDDISTKWMHYIETRWRSKLGDMVLLLIGTHNRVNAQITLKEMRDIKKYYGFNSRFTFDAQSSGSHQWNPILLFIVSRHNQIRINKEASQINTNIACVNALLYQYDRLAIIISVFDLITDIIVMLQYYHHKQTVFFALSVIIIVLCQFAYANAFVVLFGMDHSPLKRTATYVAALLIGPFLSTLIWYIIDHPHSRFVKHFLRDKLGLRVKPLNSNGKHSPFSQWVRIKLKKHLGFLLQSVLESAPQSILQMIAIVYYGNEPNIIAICSIVLSMLSVATKAIIFSRAIDVRTFIFNWLCCVVDFFSIFVTISWVFYNVSHTQNTNTMPSLRDFVCMYTFIGQVFWYKLFICVFPGVSFGVICLSLYGGYLGIKENISFWKEYKQKRIREYQETVFNACAMDMDMDMDDVRAPCTMKCMLLFQFLCHQLCIFLLLFVLCACGIVMGTVIVEMLCFTPIALLFYKLIAIKFPHKKAADYNGWNEIFRFISSYVDTNDRLLRVIAVQSMMYCVPICTGKYEEFEIYLHEQEIQPIPFIDTRFSALRKQMSFCCKEIINETFHDVIEWIEEDTECPSMLKIIGSLFCIVFVPIYVLSRALNVLFPVIILAYLTYWNLWLTTSMFQYFMLITYIVLLLIWFILAKKVFILHHSMFHIGLVGYVSENTQDKYDALLRNVQEYYSECITVSKRREMLWSQFGDVGFAIESYIPRFDVWNDE